MAARWRQENYFRFGRDRFGLDAHDSCSSNDDDAARLLRNPAKAKAKLVQGSTRAHRDSVAHAVAGAMLAISTPEPGGAGIVITNQMHNEIHAPLMKAQCVVEKAEDAYRDLDAKIPLGESPGEANPRHRDEALHEYWLLWAPPVARVSTTAQKRDWDG